MGNSKNDQEKNKRGKMKKEMTMGELVKFLKKEFSYVFVAYFIIKVIVSAINILGVVGFAGFAITSLGTFILELVFFPLFVCNITVVVGIFVYLVTDIFKTVLDKIKTAQDEK
jgi:hypothetical protein